MITLLSIKIILIKCYKFPFHKKELKYIVHICLSEIKLESYEIQ